MLIKRETNWNPCQLNSNSKFPHTYKIAIIINLINRTYLISFTHTIFYNNERKNIKQTLINNDFPIHGIFDTDFLILFLLLSIPLILVVMLFKSLRWYIVNYFSFLTSIYFILFFLCVYTSNTISILYVNLRKFNYKKIF